MLEYPQWQNVVNITFPFSLFCVAFIYHFCFHFCHKDVGKCNCHFSTHCSSMGLKGKAKHFSEIVDWDLQSANFLLWWIFFKNCYPGKHEVLKSFRGGDYSTHFISHWLNPCGKNCKQCEESRLLWITVWWSNRHLGDIYAQWPLMLLLSLQVLIQEW